MHHGGGKQVSERKKRCEKETWCPCLALAVKDHFGVVLIPAVSWTLRVRGSITPLYIIIFNGNRDIIVPGKAGRVDRNRLVDCIT